jgi:hypothetical protein
VRGQNAEHGQDQRDRDEAQDRVASHPGALTPALAERLGSE